MKIRSSLFKNYPGACQRAAGTAPRKEPRVLVWLGLPFLRWQIILIILFNIFIAYSPAQAQFYTSEQGQLEKIYAKVPLYYKRGQYLEAIRTLEGILVLLRDDFYLDTLSKSALIKPSRDEIKLMLENSKQKQQDYLDAKQAFRTKDYLKAEELFLALSQESPDSQEIKNYLNKISVIKYRQELARETVLKQQQEQQARLEAQQKQKAEELAFKKASAIQKQKPQKNFSR